MCSKIFSEIQGYGHLNQSRHSICKIVVLGPILEALNLELVRKTMNHYDILGLQKTCTTEDVKNAYVELSKRFHPDKRPGDESYHARFIEINEAYSVLSKPISRREYDVNLRQREYFAKSGQSTYSYNSWNVETTAPRWTDETESWRYQQRRDESVSGDKSQYEKYAGSSSSYYGIKGIPRLPNYVIFGGCMLIVFVGSLFHYVAIRNSRTFNVQRLNADSIKLAKELDEVRNAAKLNGRAEQIRRLEERLARNREE